MDRELVSDLVRDALVSYCYDATPPGSTKGVPWSAERVKSNIERLKVALVVPYLESFELRESYEQVSQKQKSYAEFWVVAKIGSYLEWYDPGTGEFGLGQRLEGSLIPVSIGVRGDLVRVFCAI